MKLGNTNNIDRKFGGMGHPGFVVRTNSTWAKSKSPCAWSESIGRIRFRPMYAPRHSGAGGANMGHPGQVIFPEWPMLKFAAEYLPEAAAITSPQFRECFGEAQAASALVPALESLPVGEMKYVAAGLGSPPRVQQQQPRAPDFHVGW